MQIIISPAKKMNETPDILDFQGYPEFLESADILRRYISALSYEEAKALWKCNDKIAEQNFERFRYMDLRKNLTPALIAYEGIQYQYMAPAVLEAEAVAYLQAHLRILSGFYGMLKPLDGVVPYRLEMQAKASVKGCKNLYEFWGHRLADALFSESKTIINLASKEYSKSISAWLTPEIQWITCVFGERIGDKVVEKGTLAQMARGEMVRFLAERRAETPEEIKGFDRLDYRFSPEMSSEDTYIFLKAEK